MHFFNTESIYLKLPASLQNLAICFYGLKESRIRFGKRFHQKLKELMESEKWSSAEIESYQNEKLKELIKHSYDTVPYYRDLMKGLKLTPQDIRSKADLYKLPILTKEDVRCNINRLISSSAKRRHFTSWHTSGTTGKSLHFYIGLATIAFQWAVWWRYRRRFGVDVKDWHASFIGRLTMSGESSRPPYWRWNWPERRALISMQQISPSKISDIISFLNRHSFKFYSGYPSFIHSLVLAAKEAGLKLNKPPEIIFTGAENIFDYQRRDIEDYMHCILTSQYGFAEACGNASQCPELVYHEDFEFGILECVDPSPADEEGRIKGKIVCTGFASPEFPFIRYEIGDIGVWEKTGKICACGRESKIISRIEGRIDDYVLTPEGRRIMRFDYIFKDTQNVEESQVIQEKLGEIKLKIVRRPRYNSQEESYITQEIAKWISPKLKVNFDYVDEIEREPNGKFTAVKSLINKTLI